MYYSAGFMCNQYAININNSWKEKKMETKEAKITVLVSLLTLAGLAVIFLPAYAGDPEPIARPAPKFQGVYKGELITRPEPNKYTRQEGVYEFELHRDDLIRKATPEEDCGQAEAIGFSESFSFDEAFVNAVHNLPEDTTDDYPDKMTTVRVVDIYATYGGLTGGAYLYVRVQRVADPACLSAAEKQRAEPRDRGELHKRRGELRKLPGRESQD